MPAGVAVGGAAPLYGSAGPPGFDAESAGTLLLAASVAYLVNFTNPAAENSLLMFLFFRARRRLRQFPSNKGPYLIVLVYRVVYVSCTKYSLSDYSPNSTCLVTSRFDTFTCRAHAFWLCRACRIARLDTLDTMSSTGVTHNLVCCVISIKL